VANIPVTRDELIEKVIAAIRQEPGCEGVKGVSINAINVIGEGSTWRASVLDGGTASTDDAHRAAARITDLYTRLFKLVE
jgi:hypothetical protein